MNVELLKEFIETILQYEASYGIQTRLSELQNAITNLAGAPQDENHQKGVSDNLDALAEAVARFEHRLSHKDKVRLQEINASDLFCSDFLEDIRKVIAENPMSPAVARDHLNKLASKRQTYVETITNLTGNLNEIGIKRADLDAGQAEIGFQIPREIFANNLDGLIKELRVVKQVARTFSEITTGSVEEINVGQISTSDPLLFLGLSTPVIYSIAKAVEWALDKWKTVEEVRKIRAETAQIEVFTKKEITSFYDSKIESVIDSAVTEKVEELLKGSKVDKERKNELRSPLAEALRALFSRIERGMTIELRMLPAKETTEDAGDEGAIAEAGDDISGLDAIRAQLQFPEPSKVPILQLVSPFSKDEEDNEQAPRREKA